MHERVDRVLLFEVQARPHEQEQEVDEQQRGGLEPLAEQRRHEQRGGGLSCAVLVVRGHVRIERR